MCWRRHSALTGPGQTGTATAPDQNHPLCLGTCSHWLWAQCHYRFLVPVQISSACTGFQCLYWFLVPVLVSSATTGFQCQYRFLVPVLLSSSKTGYRFSKRLVDLSQVSRASWIISTTSFQCQDRIPELGFVSTCLRPVSVKITCGSKYFKHQLASQGFQ